MQSRIFSRTFIAGVVLISIFILLWMGSSAASSVNNPMSADFFENFDQTASSAFLNLLNASTTTRAVIITAPGGIVNAVVAENSAQVERGLSGTPSMPKDSGMLFVFPIAGVYGFWMKEMNYPIDIVWMDADRRVSGVTPSVPVESYPQIYYPPAEVLYVLELNSGQAKNFGIATGTQLVF